MNAVGKRLDFLIDLLAARSATVLANGELGHGRLLVLLKSPVNPDNWRYMVALFAFTDESNIVERSLGTAAEKGRAYGLFLEFLAKGRAGEL